MVMKYAHGSDIVVHWNRIISFTIINIILDYLSDMETFTTTNVGSLNDEDKET